MNLPWRLPFEWRTFDLWNWRLSFVLAVVVLAHITAFYLFQVVYPPTKPISAQPMRITVLDPNVPAAAQLLRELEDRAFAYGPGISTELADFSLEELGAAFRPSFHAYQIPLRPINPGGTSALAGISPGRLELPPPPEVSGWGQEEERELPHLSQPKVRVGPQLANRNLQVDSEALGRALREPNGRLRAKAGVKSDGRLLYFLVSEEPEGGLTPAEVNILRSVLRFEPGAALPLQQDWIEIVW